MSMETFPPGCTFCPPDHELTDRYLHRELAGHLVPGTLDFVHHIDVYSADPEHLVEKLESAPGTGKGDKPPVWYFVSTVRSAGRRKTAGGRKVRAVVGGTWHAENKKAVKGSKLGGSIRTFTYAKKTASGDGLERLGWIMKEYDVSAQNGGGDHVLCKIYRTPRNISRASASTTTSSSVSDSGESKKRKAAGDHPDAPTPAERRRDDEGNFTENVGHVFMEGSGECEHYGAGAYFHRTRTAMHLPEGGTMELAPCMQERFLLSGFYRTAHMPRGETMKLPPCVQENFLPSTGFYGTTAHMLGGETMEFPPCVQESFMPSSEFFYGTAAHMPTGGGIDLDELLNQPSVADYQSSEEEIQAMIRELCS